MPRLVSKIIKKDSTAHLAQQRAMAEYDKNPWSDDELKQFSEIGIKPPKTKLSRGAINEHGLFRWANSWIEKSIFKQRLRRNKIIQGEYQKRESSKYSEYRKKHREKNLAYFKEYRKKNFERMSQQCREWRIANSEELKKKKAAWYFKNRDRIRKNWREKFYPENKDKLIAYQKRYAAENREIVNSRNSARRGKQKSPQGLAERFSIKHKYRIAKKLTEETGIKWDVDHIVPLCKGELHVNSNLQVIPEFVNARKGGRLLSNPAYGTEGFWESLNNYE